jgi:hypothetical protein
VNIPELNNCLFAVGNTYVVRTAGSIECHKLRQNSSSYLRNGETPTWPTASSPARARSARV